MQGSLDKEHRGLLASGLGWNQKHLRNRTRHFQWRRYPASPLGEVFLPDRGWGPVQGLQSERMFEKKKPSFNGPGRQWWWLLGQDSALTEAKHLCYSKV
uniref:S6K n=1 Tax=Arundo donax TaxID=35708 RepID=A0A0A9AIQ8_ARUDO